MRSYSWEWTDIEGGQGLIFWTRSEKTFSNRTKNKMVYMFRPGNCIKCWVWGPLLSFFSLLLYNKVGLFLCQGTHREADHHVGVARNQFLLGFSEWPLKSGPFIFGLQSCPPDPVANYHRCIEHEKERWKLYHHGGGEGFTNIFFSCGISIYFVVSNCYLC